MEQTNGLALFDRDRSNDACDLGSEGCVLHPRCFDEGRGAMISLAVYAWNGGDATPAFDACLSNENSLVSVHRYRYSMAIGDMWSVFVTKDYPSRKRGGTTQSHVGGTTYEYGYDAPRYPVPALIGAQRCRWCASDYSVCDYNGTGEWCPSLCFSDLDLY